jgi:hypothetical protein
VTADFIVAGCRGTEKVTAENGKVESHRGAGVSYLQETRNCTWLIRVAAGKVVKVWFTHMGLKSPDTELTVSDSPDADESGGSVCPRDLQIGRVSDCRSLVSATNRVTVRFRSSDEFGNSGFRLQFEAVDADAGEMMQVMR